VNATQDGAGRRARPRSRCFRPASIRTERSRWPWLRRAWTVFAPRARCPPCRPQPQCGRSGLVVCGKLRRKNRKRRGLGQIKTRASPGVRDEPRRAGSASSGRAANQGRSIQIRGDCRPSQPFSSGPAINSFTRSSEACGVLATSTSAPQRMTDNRRWTGSLCGQHRRGLAHAGGQCCPGPLQDGPTCPRPRAASLRKRTDIEGGWAGSMVPETGLGRPHLVGQIEDVGLRHDRSGFRLGLRHRLKHRRGFRRGRRWSGHHRGNRRRRGSRRRVQRWRQSC